MPEVCAHAKCFDLGKGPRGKRSGNRAESGMWRGTQKVFWGASMARRGEGNQAARGRAGGLETRGKRAEKLPTLGGDGVSITVFVSTRCKQRKYVAEREIIEVVGARVNT